MPANKSLRNLKLKRNYDPSHDGTNLLTEFYCPCLSVSTKYDRCSAYFSSAVLKSFSKGLVNFYNNGGHARFIFSCQISQEEMKLICDGYKAKMDTLVDTLDSSLDYDYEIANLSFLISHNLVDVKIAFMLNDKSALMHIKSGLFEDDNGDHVYFDGSGNETESGILLNAETFNVFDDFSGENEYVTIGINRFNKLWDNTYSSAIRTEFPYGSLFEKLLSYNREKIFDNERGFYEDLNCVLIDLNSASNSILLTDYTEIGVLKKPRVLSSQFYGRWQVLKESKYSIKNINLYDLKEVIISRLNQNGITYILTPATSEYIQRYDLELDKRTKLGLSIKQGLFPRELNDKYDEFKYIVNKETTVHLKDKQLQNAFYHYCMKSSCDFSVPGTGKTYISYGLFAYLKK